MSSPRIQAFVVDDENEDKFAAHGLSARQVLQVLENTHLIAKNRRRRRGLYLVIGTDNGGACIAVPVEPTYRTTLWRPITAWPCKQHERTILGQRRGYHESGT